MHILKFSWLDDVKTSILNTSESHCMHYSHVCVCVVEQQVNGGNESGYVSMAEWDSFKQDVLREIRAQVTHMKRDILDGTLTEIMRSLLNTHRHIT